MNNSIVKSCTIELNLNKTIEFISIKLNLTNDKSMMVCLYYGKQESRSTKKNQKTNFVKYKHTQKTVFTVIRMYS